MSFLESQYLEEAQKLAVSQRLEAALKNALHRVDVDKGEAFPEGKRHYVSKVERTASLFAYPQRLSFAKNKEYGFEVARDILRECKDYGFTIGDLSRGIQNYLSENRAEDEGELHPVAIGFVNYLKRASPKLERIRETRALKIMSGGEKK